MSRIEKIIKETHYGYNDIIEDKYVKCLETEELTEGDLEYMEKLIKAAASGQIEYTSFSDDGGVNIAHLLLTQLRLNMRNKLTIDKGTRTWNT